MLKVQEFLLQHGPYDKAIEALKKAYNIDIKEYPDRIVLNYSQIDSPKFNAVADDCRGLILAKDFKTVLSRPFTRFYNYGEGSLNKDFNFAESEIFEKCDGSLMPLYYDTFRNVWQSATRKMAFAEGQTTVGTKFEVLFANAGGWATMASMKRELEYLLNKYKEYTWIFELIGPENRVVKRYEKAELVLLGVRHTETGKYLPLEHAIGILNKKRNIARLPKTYSLNDYEEIKKSFANLDSLDEGYVCHDPITHERVKIKTPAYIAVHHIRDNGAIAPKRVSVLVCENETDEYLSYFPEDLQFFAPYMTAYKKLVEDIENNYFVHSIIKEQKKFALTIKDLPFASILFQMRQLDQENKQYTIKELIGALTDDKKLRLLESYCKKS